MYKTHTANRDTQLLPLMMADEADNTPDYMVTIITKIMNFQLEEGLPVLPLFMVQELCRERYSGNAHILLVFIY